MSYVVDIPNVSTSEVAEIVEEPARKVNKRWERDEKGISLSKMIIEDANKLQSLPLIEFALSELYKECVELDEMTFEAYKHIGRMKGAVIQYADNFFSSLSSQEKEAFRSILGSLITVSNEGANLFVRKTSVRKNIEKNEIQKNVIQKLIDAHLLVSDKDVDGNSTVSFVHEILLSSWDIVKDWCKHHKDFLEKNDHYEKLARYWTTNGCKKNDLILERSALLEAEYFMFHHENKLQPNTFDFLDKSLVKQRRKGLVKHIFLFMCALFFSACLMFVILFNEYIDEDFKSYFDYETFSWYDLFSVSIPIFVVSGHSVLLRISGKYKYKTIISSTILWSIILLSVLILSIYEFFSGRMVEWYGFLWVVPFMLCGISVVIEYHRRKLWEKHIFRPYFITDRYETTKNVVLWLLVGLSFFLYLIINTALLIDKNERNEETLSKYKSTLNIVDELFDGLNNISSQLSWSDRLYINEKRLKYLSDRFSDELGDNIPDERERQFATCLYNLHEPLKALTYLYPEDHCLYVLACAKSGLYDLAEAALEEDVKRRRLNVLSWVTPTHLVWTAEKLGRFDLADSLYIIMREHNIDWATNTADISNYGHILLMNGQVSEAISYYNRANAIYISQNPLMKETELRNQIKRSLRNDFLTMRWLEVGNQAYIDDAAHILGISIRPFLTSIEDSITTKRIHQKLIGTWALSDSSIVICIHPEVPICQYKVFKDGNEFYRTLTNCRFSEINGHIYWEELDQDVDNISSCEITSLSETEFSVKIIDNGNDADKGNVRIYYRVTENE